MGCIKSQGHSACGAGYRYAIHVEGGSCSDPHQQFADGCTTIADRMSQTVEAGLSKLHAAVAAQCKESADCDA